MSERTFDQMPKTNKSRVMALRLLVAALGLCTGLLSATGVASAAPAAPAWSILSVPFPTNVAPGSEGNHQTGPGYYILATNVGGAPTSGSFTITDVLPDGFEPSKPEGNDLRIRPFSCDSAGQTVTCTGSEPVQPGEWVKVIIPLDVAPGLTGSVSDQASIEGGGAAAASTEAPTTISDAPASFDFIPGAAGFSAGFAGADGFSASQAGSHPYQLSVNLNFPTETSGTTLAASGRVKDVITNLPRGLMVNPQATPVRCTEAQLESLIGARAGCPIASQVGTITTVTDLCCGISPITAPLYNMVPPPGTPAELGFEPLNALGIYTHLVGAVRSDGDYGVSSLTTEIFARPLNPVLGVQVMLWGNPSDESHDYLRGQCSLSGGPCPTPEPRNTAFLTLPSSCTSQPLITSASADSWEERGVFHERSFETPAINGCSALEFTPSIEAKPTTNLADSPSGLEFNMHQPQEDDYDGLSTAYLKNARVTLPPGMSVNPSGANGLGACSSAQIGLTTPVGQAAPAHFNKAPQSCPAAAKIGSMEVKSPLLSDPLPGAVYIAKPYDNPFGSLLAIYLVIEDERTGIVVKLPGRVEADPSSGQITTRFAENPEQPLEDVKIRFFGGARAALKTPAFCGQYTTTSDLTPWSTPEGADAHPADSFATSVAPGGGPCPTAAAQQPNKPAFRAGTIAPQAGAYSPFVLKLSRSDGSQTLSGIDTTLPKGLIAKLAGVSYCSPAAIAQALDRSHPGEGALEQADPSCPASSELGSVDVAAGAGISPIHVGGHAYLAGPYKGAPLSLVVITPAVAGPYDLGAVTVRAALQVDPETATVHAVSDPFPQILEGIPLDLRSVEVTLGRPDFVLNPTSCDPMAVSGIATSSLGQAASLTSPFQVGGCSALKFAPKLAFRLKGPTKRTGHPALQATVTYPKGAYANIAKAQVTLPRSEFLDQSHIKTICTRVQFAAKQCPPGAIYGFAKATTPLLDGPLSGPVYLRSSSHELPDLVAELNGQIDVAIAGRIDSINGRIRATFEAVPDAPVSKFTVEMKGGKKGLLVNSVDLCKATSRATALFDGQNGKTFDSKPIVATSCKGKSKAKSHKSRGKAHR